MNSKHHHHSGSTTGTSSYMMLIILYSTIVLLFTTSLSFNHHHHNSTTTHHHQQKIQELEQENENLRSQNQKVENENRILKRAVTIQQDRQHQLNEELEGARRFKEQAEERIRRLEQMNVTLQYQLQAQSSSAGNDFMGFSPRPPDVY